MCSTYDLLYVAAKKAGYIIKTYLKPHQTLATLSENATTTFYQKAHTLAHLNAL